MTETEEYYLGAVQEIAKTEQKFTDQIMVMIANIEARTGLRVKELRYDNKEKELVVDWDISIIQSRAEYQPVKTIKLTA